MMPETRIDREGKPIPGDAYRCQVHPIREYHPHIGYCSFPTSPFKDVPPPLLIECHTLYMYIASASSDTDVTLRCVSCQRERQEFI